MTEQNVKNIYTPKKYFSFGLYVLYILLSVYLLDAIVTFIVFPQILVGKIVLTGLPVYIYTILGTILAILSIRFIAKRKQKSMLLLLILFGATTLIRSVTFVYYMIDSQAVTESLNKISSSNYNEYGTLMYLFGKMIVPLAISLFIYFFFAVRKDFKN
ncbi:MAG: hypothetical protein DWP97_09240 [Calditrichaeota bacterium]|nr:MAG: hypothetical protein DWP97_09240 [Calditrichota bacterium]